jgi:uncharacterized protein (TIGR03086 family)
MGTTVWDNGNGANVMEPDLLGLYERASAWTVSMAPDAVENLHASTPCDGWDVATLMNHMLDTQRYFVSAARGENAAPPYPDPPELIGDDPVAAFDAARAEMVHTYRAAGVIEKTGPSLGIAFSDQLLHGWDLAKATGQHATMPNGLAEVAFDMIHGRFTDEQRKGVFKPEIKVPSDASAQGKLLAYTGRAPSR